MRRDLCLILTLAASVGFASGTQTGERVIPNPESHLGFKLGRDGRLASWTQLASYYGRLAAASDRLQLRRLGESTLGNPFLLVIISSPANHMRLEGLATISRTLADPRGLSEADVDRLVAEGKSVVAVTVGLHSTEVAATQMAAGLAYRLAAGQDLETLRILKETVFLLFACFNPDGTEMVADWVERTRGTKYQGSRVPDLYHHYAGHDDNRDSYMLTQKESQMFARVVYREWVPQLYLDVHQMSSYGARLYVPPYEDPINPNVDPLNWLEHELVGANMRIALEREGITGVVAGSPYTGWWFPSFHMITNHHNIAGMLTETASARLVWPLFIHPHQLKPHGRSHVVYGPMQLFPHPWPGGWWRLEDLIRQQEVSTLSLLSTAAQNREMLLRNMVFKARRTIQRGRENPPYAFLVPAQQHDSPTVRKLIATLMKSGVEIGRATQDFVLKNRAYSAGDYVISLAQPKGVLVRSLLAQARYPDNAVTRAADGSIQAPYDLANFVLSEHMGVEAIPAGSPVEVPLEKVERPPRGGGRLLGSGEAGWLLSHRLNDAFRAMNRILANGGEVYWLKEGLDRGGRNYLPGAIWIPGGSTSPARIESLAQELALEFRALETAPSGGALKLQPLRLGMYRRYLRGNMDEGWSRFLFDTWEFSYQRLEVDQIQEGRLEQLDVFVVPKDGLDLLTEAPASATEEKKEEEVEEEYPEIFLPPRYRRRLDRKAIGKIKEFVRGGGTLVLLDQASQLAPEHLGVPVRDLVKGVPRTQYFCPGSTLRAHFDSTHPLAYGMPSQGLILNWGSPVFEIEQSVLNAQIAAPVTYAKENVLKSGWLIGENRIAGKAAALDIAYGKGRIILIGFRAQHRAQTHGTFKIFFNALYYGSAQEVELH